MDELEMAFFYGDFSSLKLLAQAVLLEISEDSDTPE